ncbi:MAG TPA: M13 family metallopeptidase [Opitutaceae bacterium]|nr:M13 family metallopeptidase [Opitutaceae bacterium]
MRKHTLTAVAVLFASVSAAFGGIEPQYFDRSVKPQDDFFQFVNGTWLKTVPIPSDLARYGSFTILQEDNWAKLHDLCEQAARDTAATGVEKIVSDFYASGMNVSAIAAAGAKPLQSEFDRIAAIKTPDDVLHVLGHLRMLGVHAGFGFAAAPDDKDSKHNIAVVRQSGLGLAITDQSRDADRDYYFNPDAKSRRLRQQYVAHIAKMFELLGDEPAAATAEAGRVMRLETELALASSSRVQLRDPQANYHKITVAELPEYTGDMDWNSFLSETNAPKFDVVNVAQPDFLRAFATLLRVDPVDDWKLYLRWQLIRRAAPYLGGQFESENFKFFGTDMTGVTAQEPRWKRVVITTDDSIGDALGQLYVAKYFPPEAKARALELVANLRAALRERLQTLPWMDAETRAKAVAKLDAFTVKIGYPDTWKDYSSAHIDRGPYVLNVLRADEFEVRRNLAKIGQPVDKMEWYMTPPTVNAYYSSSINGITFPAGILQPPFFDPKADDAVNYGGIGVVIGHEMTHGFDDSGRQFDADGNLHDWWTPQSAAQFKERAAGIVKQFSDYVAVDDIHLNGALTQGENIADLGGLRIAYAAMEKALAGKPRTLVDGFTPEQQFFISYATIWRDAMRPAEAARRARVDPHSPGKWRVDGPLSNLDEFAKAFDVSEGAPMRRSPAERVLIW